MNGETMKNIREYSLFYVGYRDWKMTRGKLRTAVMKSETYL
jgi:hypothetical protein